MEARPFSVFGVLRSIIDNLLHLYPLLLLGALVIELPLSLAEEALEGLWNSLPRIPTPLVVFGYFYTGFIASGVWERAQSHRLRPLGLLLSLQAVALSLGAWCLIVSLAGHFVLLTTRDAGDSPSILVALAMLGLYFPFILVVPVLVIERCGLPRALSRSLTLVRGKWLQSLGVVVVVLILGATLELVYFALPRVIGYDDFYQAFHWATFRWVLTVMDALAPPIWQLLIAVLYVGLRRDEEFHLALKAQEGAEAPSSD